MAAELSPDQLGPGGWSLNVGCKPGGTVIITARGEFDVAAVADVQQAISSAVSLAETPPHLVVDLSEVAFLDASMLGVLVAARHSLRARAGDLVITGVTPWALRIIEICGLRQTLGL